MLQVALNTPRLRLVMLHSIVIFMSIVLKLSLVVLELVLSQAMSILRSIVVCMSWGHVVTLFTLFVIVIPGVVFVTGFMVFIHRIFPLHTVVIVTGLMVLVLWVIFVGGE